MNLLNFFTFHPTPTPMQLSYSQEKEGTLGVCLSTLRTLGPVLVEFLDKVTFSLFSHALLY